jgi:hypothetical protein
MNTDTRELDTVRELSAIEIEQVSGGTITVYTPPFWIIPQPKPPKPLQA